ncbi:hypothetical protein H0H92_015718 [Tricholoma furcatifolium]|nr:hypothetical protein H0H92_015718 [Tricholoma furcatifolium]
MPVPTPANTIFFLCDLQGSSILGFEHLVFTANKLLKLANIVGCEVVSCTQAARGTFDKTTFSMVTSEVQTLLLARPHIKNVILFGIEVRIPSAIVRCSRGLRKCIFKAHICVLQTAISLLRPTFSPEPYTPYVIADCLASHNPWEVPIVLQRLAQEGAFVSTSESIGFQLINDAKHPKFREFSKLIKDTKEGTTRAGEALIAGKKSESDAALSHPVKTSL